MYVTFKEVEGIKIHHIKRRVSLKLQLMENSLEYVCQGDYFEEN